LILVAQIPPKKRTFTWLPSLDPTAYLQAENPAHPSVKFYNVFVGHLSGVIAGFAGVFLFNAMNDPVVLVDHQLTVGRLGAAVVALALTLLIDLLLKASHPPAGATTLLVALGSIKTVNDVLNLVAGVLIIALLGELARRIRLGSYSRLEVEPKVPTIAGR
jgi:CBS-domain-containing membrane protein